LFKTIVWNFMPMGAMVKGSKPWDAAEFKRRSIAVAFAAVQLDEAFSAGSDKGAVTDALPAIWENPDDFAAKLKAFQKTSNALRMAAAAGDQDRIKAAFNDVRQSCGNCHETYRAE
ncbi:MAG TPA: cytochrome c, partial [Pseudomonadota bacterium]|nr:cytochrome c [Pseudomonadota bacterium]